MAVGASAVATLAFGSVASPPVALAAGVHHARLQRASAGQASAHQASAHHGSVAKKAPLRLSPPTTTAPKKVPRFTVVKVTPGHHAQDVPFRAPITVTFNRAPSSPTALLPTISPRMVGLWVQNGDRLVFRPRAKWRMGTTYRVTVPAPPRGAFKGHTVVRFTTALPPVLLLQQYLAMLGYLPLRFTPAGDLDNREAALARLPTTSGLVPETPLAGTFSWAYPNIPASLADQWHPGQANVLTMGAVMQFEDAEGLAPDGVAGPQVWHALVDAVAKRQMDTSPYNYIIVSESLPETLYVWQDGSFVYNTLVNTGVPGASTPQGTWPVAYKQDPNLMKGCDVDGYCYQVWVRYASYFLPSVGDAIHAYPRGGYGYPQSNGCIEVSPAVGETVYGYDPVGSLVTVSSWVGPAQ